MHSDPSRAVNQGGGAGQTEGCPDLDLSFLCCPLSSFFVLFGTFPIFSRIFPVCPFPLSRPIDSTHEEQSRKGLRHRLNLSRKKWETPRLSFSQMPGLRMICYFQAESLVHASYQMAELEPAWGKCTLMLWIRSTEIWNFGVISPLDVFFLILSSDYFPFSPGSLRNSVGNHSKMWRKLPDFRAIKNAQNLVTSLVVMVFCSREASLAWTHSILPWMQDPRREVVVEEAPETKSRRGLHMLQAYVLATGKYRRRIANQSAMDRGQKSAQMTESCLAGVQKGLLGRGATSLPKSLALGQTRFAPVQPHVAPVQQAFCSNVRKDLLCPLQSTLGQIS